MSSSRHASGEKERGTRASSGVPRLLIRLRELPLVAASVLARQEPPRKTDATDATAPATLLRDLLDLAQASSHRSIEYSDSAWKPFDAHNSAFAEARVWPSDLCHTE